MELHQLGRNVVESVVHVVDRMEQIHILRRDHPHVDQVIEVDHLVPELRPVQHDRHLLRYLSGLHQRQGLHQLVQRAEPAREDHHGVGKGHKKELAHEEVMELEVQRRRDVLVRHLLERKGDVQADRIPPGHMRPQVCRLHDSRPPAAAYHETLRAILRRDNAPPVGKAPRKLGRILVVAGHLQLIVQAPKLPLQFGRFALARLHCGPRFQYLPFHFRTRGNAGGAEEDNGTLDVVLLQPVHRLHVFGHDPENAGLRTVDEFRIVIGFQQRLIRPLHVGILTHIVGK